MEAGKIHFCIFITTVKNALAVYFYNNLRFLIEYMQKTSKIFTLSIYLLLISMTVFSQSKTTDIFRTIQNNDIPAKRLTQFQTSPDLDKRKSKHSFVLGNDILSQQKIRSQKIIISLIIGSLLLFLVFSYIFFRLNRSYQKLNKELQERNKRMAHKNTILLKNEKELKEINESKNVLFSIVAHDIKNPLYSMLRLADVLEDKYEKHSDEKRKNYLKMLNLAGKELASLIENLLSWSRFQLGSIKYQPTPFTIEDACNFATGFFKHMADLKEIDLSLDIKSSYMVYADFSMIMLVIRNITNNAIKYTQRKGNIKICATESGDYIRLEIADNGIGMDKNTLNKLFHINKGTSRLGTEGEKGTGLGLTICKEFISKNKGEFGVNSEPGQGSTFWFTVPKLKK